jgi:hypothetical protein
MVTAGQYQQSCRATPRFNDVRSPSDSPRLMKRSMCARERVVIAQKSSVATVARQVHSLLSALIGRSLNWQGLGVARRRACPGSVNEPSDEWVRSSLSLV